MQYIKAVSELANVSHDSVRDSIRTYIKTLEQQYHEPYQATLHGWFIICENDSDLTQPIANLSFSLAEKLHSGEVEFVEKKQDWFEVYITLNDNEGILVFVPIEILQRHKINPI
ncbi:hypothetical protein [Acinetobacter rudis]|uniref:Uncharacterized protein n=1 Tax=Acinetobacter rudis TaxID=632955 RepID=A0AAW8JC00_9GAMM|nr:hypothetical protein [Acinetobacter rudis]MDQ8937123.1 hypothetical protein [Acinetobacter rudis]MDQ9019334.1 hypothetical protein [Acinetobacter rudis]